MLRIARNIILSLCLVTGVMHAAAGQNHKDSLDSANAAYARGDFERSIQLYESIIEDGMIAAKLYYNLGNALRLSRFDHSI